MNEEAQKQIERLQRQLRLAKEALRQDHSIQEKYQETLKLLRQKERFATTLLESNSNAVIVTDITQTILVFNRRAEEMFGIDKREVIGRQDLGRIIPTRLLSRYTRLIMRALNENPEALQSDRRIQIEAKRSDLSTLPVRIGFALAYDAEQPVVILDIVDITDELRVKQSLRSMNQMLEKMVETRTEALQSQYALFETLFERAPDAIMIFDADMLIQCNEKMVQLFGFDDKSMMTGIPLDILWPTTQPDGRDSVATFKQMQTIALQQDGSQFEMSSLKRDGRTFWTEITLTPIQLDDDEVIHANIRDITALKQAEELERQLTEHMELALEGSNLGVWDWDLIDNSVYLSPYWKKMLGYRDDELPNEFASWQDNVHPDDLEEALKALKLNIAGETDAFENYHRLRHKDGHWVWIHDLGNTTFDESGRAIRMNGTHMDVTRQKELELEYAHQAQIIEQVHDAIITTDLDKNILSWNNGATTMLGYSADEMIGRPMSAIYHEEDIPRLHQSIALLDHKKNLSIDLRMIRQDRSIIHTLLSLSILHDEVGRPVSLISYAKDVTESKRAHDELVRQHDYLQAVIDGLEEPLMVIRDDYSLELMNSVLRKQIDYDHVADPKNPKCYEVSHHRNTPCDTFMHPCPLKEVLEGQKPIKTIHQHEDGSGGVDYVELLATPMFDEQKRCYGIIESTRDISVHVETQERLRQQKEVLDYQAHHDPLTRLPNRTLFNDRLRQGIQKARRSGIGLALFFIDLDRFKQINDSLGHEVGDKVLQKVTERLQSKIREEDTLARLGGDEFTLIMEGLYDHRLATELAKKILKALKEPLKIDGRPLYISSSIGISLYPQDSDNGVDLLKNADTAMYKAKEEGRSNFQFYSTEMTELVRDKIETETLLRQAIDHGGLIIYYQPQIDATKQTIVGLEALVRWDHPKYGIIPPGRFLPLAKETGLIEEIDRWVIETAMRQVSQWRQEGLQTGRLALNIGMRLLEKDSFLRWFKSMIESSGLPTGWLELEVTESEVMQRPEQTITKLTEINALGVTIAIDDFGTGYSSLGLLKRLPIDKLKIDMSFIHDLPDDEANSAITATIIAMAKSLSLHLIAEGVENKRQNDFLIEHGCIQIQGFYYASPMPAQELVKRLVNIDS